jgi:hypothetical protein
LRGEGENPILWTSLFISPSATLSPKRAAMPLT